LRAADRTASIRKEDEMRTLTMIWMAGLLLVGCGGGGSSTEGKVL